MSESTFTPEELTLLTRYTTAQSGNVFALRNLPEVLKGALFSRYSRSDRSLRELLVREFLGDLGGENSIETAELAEAFYDRVLVGYGDDSVAELGGAHIACEGISNIAAKVLEDSRLGISPLEKSTRYVAFDRQVDGQYQYYREPEIMDSVHRELYTTTLDRLFVTYTNLLTPLLTYLQSIYPRDLNTSERAYTSATKAKAFDLLRGLLPMATLTNVGLYGNGRAFEYLLVKLAASPHLEAIDLGNSIQAELDKVIPSFVKRAKSDRGREYVDYLVQTRNIPKMTAEIAGEDLVDSHVTLVEFDPDAEAKVVAAILYPHSHLSMLELQEYAASLDVVARQEIIDRYSAHRQSRFHRPGRALEECYYTFDIVADIGAYRDLHRHRICTQERQAYTVKHGYVVPPELITAGLDRDYRHALEQAAAAVELVSTSLPTAAQYMVPLAYRLRWRMRLNLREAYHLIELRSARQGHPGYRSIAQDMYRLIDRVHPSLTANLKFVDLADYDLERLSAEQKLDRKRERQD
jgi:thymidylate synthase ThyX